jgi:hypothetical protein
MRKNERKIQEVHGWLSWCSGQALVTFVGPHLSCVQSCAINGSPPQPSPVSLCLCLFLCVRAQEAFEQGKRERAYSVLDVVLGHRAYSQYHDWRLRVKGAGLWGSSMVQKLRDIHKYVAQDDEDSGYVDKHDSCVGSRKMRPIDLGSRGDLEAVHGGPRDDGRSGHDSNARFVCREVSQGCSLVWVYTEDGTRLSPPHSFCRRRAKCQTETWLVSLCCRMRAAVVGVRKC